MPKQKPAVQRGTGRTTAYVFFLAALTGAYAALPVWKEHSVYQDWADAPSQIHAGLSVVLGWLLVFRTNTAYSRWWEARTLWGGLVNASRNLSLKLCNLGRISSERLERAKKVLIAFPTALRCILRDEVATKLPDEIRQLVGNPRHVGLELVDQLYAIVADAKRAGEIDGDDLRVIDSELLRFLDITGGCERIQKTRIVKSYKVFARQCVWIFLLSLPWGIVNDFDYWTVPITMIIAYFMLGLEVVAEHVEEPFGYDDDDLDLDGMCLTIRNSVEEVFHHRKK